MTDISLWPPAPVAWDRIANAEADGLLVGWGHWLGACNRPFGRQSWGLALYGDIVAVAVSASTVNAMCGGYPRSEVVELARLCAHPEHRELTRVALRLWRVTAPAAWARSQWPVRAVVSYANAARHRGNIYRFDGWHKVADVPGGTAGGGWQRGKAYEAKTVWAYDLPAVDRHVVALEARVDGKIRVEGAVEVTAAER